MEESSSKNYKEYHPHPLLLLADKEKLLVKDEDGDLPRCTRCGQDAVTASCLGCEEDDCGFYLHKVCADAPLELDHHPFHPHHPLLLSIRPQYKDTFPFRRICEFCAKTFTEGSFSYGCSCGLDFHIRCALFTFNLGDHNSFIHLDEHVALEQNPSSVYFGRPCCYFCGNWVGLESRRHYSPDFGFALHEKCVKLPPKLNHPCHRKHPLSLQFDHQDSPCKICHETKLCGISYACSPCKFFIHIKCLSPSPTIEDQTYHPHPFKLFLRQASFTCDACGTAGSHAAYACLECNLQVHKECTSLPRFIKSKWHDHRVSHRYSLHREYFTTSDCIICNEEVDTDYGCYCCKFCNVIFHAKCATKDESSYEIVSDDEESLDESIKSFTVIERNDAGEATVIEHCKHIGHHLILLSDRVSEYDDKCCDGCLLPISASFYYCSNSECDFVLHKVCAEFPKEKQVWHHRDCRKLLVLAANEFFVCTECKSVTSGFGYKCEECTNRTCLRCIIALAPGVRTHPGHEHPLFFYSEKLGICHVCHGDPFIGVFGCKKCDFCLDRRCFSLPITTRHKGDKHRLALTYHDNGYSASHYCDICEKYRDPNPWFYHCEECDTSAHVDCVIDQHSSFIKIGSTIYKEDVHPHRLTVVKNMYYKEDVHPHRLTVWMQRLKGVVGYNFITCNAFVFEV